MADFTIHPDKSEQGDEEVVAIVSMEIFNKKEYEGLKVDKISSLKVVDDWGVVIKEVHPMVFVGQRRDIENKFGSFVDGEWVKYDSKRQE